MFSASQYYYGNRRNRGAVLVLPHGFKPKDLVRLAQHRHTYSVPADE